MTSGKLGGRPRGVATVTNARSGCYARPEQLFNVLQFWKRHSPGRYMRVHALIQKYLRLLKWDNTHPRLNEIRDLSVRTVSRAELLMIIIEKNFTRDVYDKTTGRYIESRPADQIQTMEKLDDEIQGRLVKLGLIKINGYINKKQETEIKTRRLEEI